MNINSKIRESKYTKNHCLDFLKGIGCIGIVFIHAKFPGNLGIIISLIAGFAVPMFLMISGYYVNYDSREMVSKNLPRKIKHMLLLCCISFIIYFMYSFLTRYFKGGLQEVNQWLHQIFTIKEVAKFVAMNNLDTISAGPMWFLFALLYCYILLIIINKFNLYKLAYYIIPFLFLFRILITGISGYNWHYIGNFALGGFPFFMLGNFFARKKAYIFKLDNKLLIFISFISALFGILSTWIKFRINVFNFGIIIYAICIFIYAHNNPNKTKYIIEKFGKKYSLFIYIMHPICIPVIAKMAKVVRVSGSITFGYFEPIIVAICTSIGAYIYYYIKDKIITKQHSKSYIKNNA